MQVHPTRWNQYQSIDEPIPNLGSTHLYLLHLYVFNSSPPPVDRPTDRSNRRVWRALTGLRSMLHNFPQIAQSHLLESLFNSA